MIKLSTFFEKSCLKCYVKPFVSSKTFIFSSFWTPKMVMNKWIVQLSRTVRAADMVRPLKMIKKWICHKFWILYQLSPAKSHLRNETTLNKNPNANQHKRSNYMRTSTNKNKHYKVPRSSNQSVIKSYNSSYGH